jgi:RNA polymerase sigma-70 factor (ECF subfamily)
MGPRREGTELATDVLLSFGRGEEDGVRAAYQRYAGPVYVVAMSVLGDRHLAAEAVQETFIRAWRAAARYNPEQGLAPWLFTIARRVSIDISRARRRVAVAVIDDEAPASPPPQLESLWEAYQVRRAVDQLPTDERQVVRLQHFEQLTHAEIAERLGIPLGTVKSRSHRAHRRLAQWLHPLLIDQEPIAAPDAYPRYSDSGAGDAV